MDVIYFVFKVMNVMKYDVMVFGNYEFNFGLDYVDWIMKELNFFVFGVNIKIEDGGIFGELYMIINVDGIKIGIIGVMILNVFCWDGDKVDGFMFEYMGEMVKKYV